MACAESERPRTSSSHRKSRPIVMSLSNLTKTSLERPNSVMGIRFDNESAFNPEPYSKEEKEAKNMSEYMSPTRLKAITGKNNLEHIKTLELRVDTTENSLGDFGIYLPNLSELKLSNSTISSMRDLGTSLKGLSILWMARCGLNDIDGISSLPSIKELYLAFNNITDISGLGMLEHLEVLDLESNEIDDITQVYFLAVCPQLVTLTLEGNPICNQPSPDKHEAGSGYRMTVHESLASLALLDGIPFTKNSSKAKGHTSNSLLKDEWRLVNEGIKYRSNTLDQTVSQSPVASPRPFTSQASRSSLENAMSQSQSPTVTRNTDEVSEAQDNSSELTHGINQVICGNPSKALKARRSKVHIESPLTTSFIDTPVPSHPVETPETEHLYDDNESRDEVFAELRRWRQDYEQLTHVLKDRVKADLNWSPSLASQSVAAFQPTPPKGPRRPTPPSGKHPSQSRPVPERPQSAVDFRLRRFHLLSSGGGGGTGIEEEEVEKTRTRPQTGPVEIARQPRPPRPREESRMGGQRRRRPMTARPDLGNK